MGLCGAVPSHACSVLVDVLAAFLRCAVMSALCESAPVLIHASRRGGRRRFARLVVGGSLCSQLSLQNVFSVVGRSRHMGMQGGAEYNPLRTSTPCTCHMTLGGCAGVGKAW